MKTKPVMLVADDIELNRTLLKEIFDKEYEVVEANDGEEALSILKTMSVEIILLDLVMPKMTGFDVLEFLSKDPKLCKIPVIVNTQYGEDENQVKALSMGAVDFIAKPYNPRVVRQRVHNIMIKTVLEHAGLEQNLKATNQQMASLIQAVPGGIAICQLVNRHLHIRYFNDRVCEFCGYTREEFAELKCHDLVSMIHPDDRERLSHELISALQENQIARVTYRMYTRDHREVWVSLSAVKFHEESGNPIFHAIFVDATQEKRFEQQKINMLEEYQYRLEHDLLTEIDNRSTFCAKTSRMLMDFPDKSFLVLRSDIANFKVINDLFGSGAGDQVLKAMAQKFQRLFHHIGTYGRLEADNFAACIPKDQFNIEQIIRAMDEIVREQSIQCNFITYFGIYEVEDRTIPIDQMCDRANMALLTIKGSYIKRYAFYDDHLRQELLEEQKIVGQMNTALEQHQFQIHLQPMYSVTDHQLVGAEALVRWHHPEWGIVLPDKFIPVFEKNGFIMKMDYYVWESACQYLRDSLDSGKKIVPISVNVSRKNLYNPDLCFSLITLIEKYHLNPSLLKLEITETAYTDNPRQLLDAMKILQQYGFKILMDDFGSGYSSLNMLKDVPVDILKIDMRFMEDLEKSDRAGNVLTSIIRMAKWLHMEVVAEGVETNTQVDFLRSIGCDTAQGYYYSKPLAIPDFCTLLEQDGLQHPENKVSIINNLDFDAVLGSNSKTNLILNDMIGAMGIYELRGKSLEIIRVNDGYYELFGETPKTLFKDSQNVISHIIPSDREKLLHTCHAAIHSQKAETVFLQRVHKNGSVLWISLKIKYLGNMGDGSLFYAICNDVTNQKKVEVQTEKQGKALIRHHNYLETLYRSLPCGVAQFSLNQPIRLLTYNPAVCQIFGFDKREQFEKIVYKDISTLIYPEDRELFYSKIHQLSCSNGKQQFEMRILKADGSIGYVRQTIQMIFSPEQDQTLIQDVFMDITEEKRMEEERILHKYHAALFGVFDEIFELNFKTQTAVTVESRLHTKRMIGKTFPLAQALETWVTKRVHPEDRIAVSGFMMKGCQAVVQSGGQSLSIEYRVIDLAGKEYWCMSTLLKVEDDCFLCCNKNITDYKRSELLRKKYEQLKEKQRQQERYQIIVERTGTLVFEWDIETKEFYTSKGFEVFALSQSSPIDLKQNQIPTYAVHPDDVEILKGFYAQTKSGKSTAEAVLRLKKTDGSFVWCRVTGNFVQDKNGRLIRSIGTINLIDEQKKAEINLQQTKEQLEQSTKELYHLLNHLSVGIGIYELGPTPRPRYLNEQIRKMFLMQEKADVSDLQIQNVSKTYQYTQNHTYVAQGKYDLVCQMKRTDGTKFWTRIFSQILPGQGSANPMCYAVFADVTKQMEKERDYRRQNELYRMLVEEIQMLVFDFDAKTQQITFSFMKEDGTRTEQVIQNYVEFLNQSKMLHPRFRKLFQERIKKACEEQTSDTVDFLADYLGNGYRWYRAFFRSLRDCDETIYRIIGYAYDITSEKEMEDLLLKEKSYRQVMMSESLFVYDFDLEKQSIDLVYQMPGSEEEFYTYDSYLMNAPENLERIHPSDLEKLKKLFYCDYFYAEYQKGNNEIKYQYRIRTKDDRWVWVQATVFLMQNKNSEYLRGLGYVKLIEEQRKLKKKAEIDFVSGLYNRATTEERINEYLQKAKATGVLFLYDIDDFKSVNDTYGHLSGDRLLARISEIFSDSFRKEDIVGRIGGDEFVVFLPQVDDCGAIRKKAEDTLNQIRHISEEFGWKIPISISLGIAQAPQDGTKFNMLYQAADRALYHVKNTGKNAFYMNASDRT